RRRQRDPSHREPGGARRGSGRQVPGEEDPVPRAIDGALMTSKMTAIVDRWSTFWFTPAPAYALGLVRMVFGVVAVVWTLALLPVLYRVFGEQGVAPLYPQVEYQWG